MSAVKLCRKNVQIYERRLFKAIFCNKRSLALNKHPFPKNVRYKTISHGAYSRKHGMFDIFLAKGKQIANSDIC